jgi:phosphatidylinositol glycan class Q protein
VIEGLLVVFNTPLLFNLALIDKSETLQQIDIRLQQLCFWPWQYYLWTMDDNKLSPKAQARYIGFWNVVWLIANDIITGFAVRRFLLDNSVLVQDWTLALSRVFNLQVVQQMDWLMHWPAGLKLNTELSSFFGELYTWMVRSSHSTLNNADYISSHGYLLALIIPFAAYSGLFGVTIILSIASDLSSLITAHLNLLYSITAKIYYWQCSIMASTYNMFRGKKYNPLRKRIDAAESDLDQTLLGTIIFTLLIFLFPTVCAYYLLFSVVLLSN